MTTLTNAILALAGGLPLAAAQQTPAQRFAELQAGLVKEVTGWLRSDDIASVAWGAHAAATFGLTDRHGPSRNGASSSPRTTMSR